MRGSLKIRNGMYHAVFSYKGYDGRYKTKSYSTKIPANDTKTNQRLAEKKLKELREVFESEREKLEMPINYLIEYMDEWLKSMRGQIDEVTYRSYQHHIDRHFKPYFNGKNLKLANVTTKDIDGYYAYKTTGGRLDGKAGGLSRESIKRHSVVLNLMFKEAKRQGLIKENPCDYAAIPKQTTDNAIKTLEFYSVEQCDVLLAVTKGTILHDMIFITILYGLRRSELMGLRWKDVDFAAKTITIQHTIVASHGKPIAKDKTKSKSSHRVYPLLDDVADILHRLQEQQDEYRKLYGNCYTETGYIWTKEDGTTYFPSYPSQKIHKVIKANGLPSLKWHGLRHSCASMLMLKGWHVKDISEWLGHADISTTMNVYTHINLEHKTELGKELNNILSY